jgi:hypothetical protein
MKKVIVILWVASLMLAVLTAEAMNIVFVLATVTYILTSIKLRDERKYGDEHAQ